MFQKKPMIQTRFIQRIYTDTEPFVLFLLVSVSILNRGEKVCKRSCTELNGHLISNEQYLHNAAIFEAIN
jgi:hypothetical protein